MVNKYHGLIVNEANTSKLACKVAVADTLFWESLITMTSFTKKNSTIFCFLVQYCWYSYNTVLESFVDLHQIYDETISQHHKFSSIVMAEEKSLIQLTSRAYTVGMFRKVTKIMSARTDSRAEESTQISATYYYTKIQRCLYPVTPEKCKSPTILVSKS